MIPRTIVGVAAVVLPLTASAQASQIGSLQDVVDFIVGFVGLLVPVLIGITFVYILWGITKAWIIQGGTEEGVDSGKMVVVTGVIGLIVIVGMWGIVSLVRSAIFF